MDFVGCVVRGLQLKCRVDSRTSLFFGSTAHLNSQIATRNLFTSDRSHWKSESLTGAGAIDADEVHLLHWGRHRQLPRSRWRAADESGTVNTNGLWPSIKKHKGGFTWVEGDVCGIQGQKSMQHMKIWKWKANETC